MATIFIDGFDKYGPVGQTNPTVVNLFTAGEWTSVTGTDGGYIAVVPPLSYNGTSLQLVQISVSATTVLKTLQTSYSRFIGGFRFSSTLVQAGGFAATHNGSNIWSVEVAPTTGIVSLVAGETTLGSGGAISQNSVHYLEFDVTIGASSPYQIWLDGVSLISGTGNTGSSSANGFNFYVYGIGGTFTVDDFYLFDETTSFNNAVLLTSPRIETQYPNGDSQKEFTNQASLLGYINSSTSNTSAPGANKLFLRQFAPEANMTLNSVSCVPQSTNSLANFTSVLYSNNSGAPNDLLATGIQVTGCFSGQALTSNLGTPYSLTASTSYWIGFITDTSINLAEVDTSLTGQVASNTYIDGPPATAPSMTANQNSWQIWGNCTGSTVNWVSVNVEPSPGDYSYVSSETVDDEDLYEFPPISITPTAIYTMVVKGNVRVDYTGHRSANLQTKSGGTDSSGSNSGQVPPTTYEWIDSAFDTDPNTGVAWTESGLNAAVSGVSVAS